MRGVKGRTGGHGVFQQGRLGEGVQDLGQVGFHPRALACGQDDQCCFHVFLIMLCLLSLYALRTKAQERAQ
jgi:hypothetical protein